MVNLPARIWRRPVTPAAPGSWRAILRSIGQLAPVAAVRRFFGWVAALGVSGYPPDVQRRLKILNMIAALIAVATLQYAIHLAMSDFETMKPVVFINLAIVAVVLLVPLAHRINDMAGGLLIVGAELIALIAFGSFFGRSGGTQVQYIVFAAAPFVVFGPKRLKLVLAIVFAAFVLHLVVWFRMAEPLIGPPVDQHVVDELYFQGAVTTFVLIAASVYYAFSLVERAKAETDAVLRNILPDAIVERLKAKPDEPIADGFAEASILFADISGFVAMARQLGPEKTVAFLNKLVAKFDALAERHGVEKIKTIGDAYMIASGVPNPRPDHAHALARMALDMVETTQGVARDTGIALNMRIGMAGGPIMAGVIGTKKFTYDVWGDAVNLASRLEGASRPGRILVCPLCYEALKNDFDFETRGPLEIKGVGAQEAWFLVQERGHNIGATAPALLQNVV